MAGFIEADVGPDSSHLTRISMVLIWLKPFNTNILIILNTELNSSSDSNPQFNVMQVASSLKIVDTNLFNA